MKNIEQVVKTKIQLYNNCILCCYCNLFLKTNDFSINNKYHNFKTCNKCREKMKKKEIKLKCLHDKRRNQCSVCNISAYRIQIIRNRINTIINLNNCVKTKSTIKYLGCTPDYFIEWIENKFTLGMQWDNIHLDHIKPVSRFNLIDNNEINEKELSMCFHYTNHQPLFADANLHKSNKWSKEEELYWRENIIDKSLL